MSQRLKYLREHNNLSQRDISNILGIKYQQYQRYEKEINKISLKYLIKLAEYYKTSTDYILGITDEKEPYHKI